MQTSRGLVAVEKHARRSLKTGGERIAYTKFSRLSFWRIWGQESSAVGMKQDVEWNRDLEKEGKKGGGGQTYESLDMRTAWCLWRDGASRIQRRERAV